MAAQLHAEKLVLLTDTPGILLDQKDEASLVRSLDAGQCRDLMARGIITGNNFLGRFGCRHRQVVYLDRENSPHRIKHRGQIIRIDAGNPLLKYWSKLQADLFLRMSSIR